MQVEVERILCTLLWVMTVALMPGPVQAGATDKRVTVGNKNFTEQYIMGELMKQLLEDRGFRVDLRSDLTSMALRGGMESGDIDVCADYTGTAWMVHLKRQHEPGMGHNGLYELVNLAEKKNRFIWLHPMWNNSTYALASWPEFASKHQVATLTDLAGLYKKKDGKIETFVNFEFSIRPDGLSAMEAFYGFKVAKTALKAGTPGASLIALREHETDIAMVFGTDASIAKYGWHVYRDDKSFFPPYDLTPYVREDVLDKYPEIADIINALVATFPGGDERATPQIVSECQKIWQKLNEEVDIEKTEPKEVALHYLVQHSLIKR